jgi:hypothetical protein
VATLLTLLISLLIFGSAGIHNQLERRQKLSKLLSTMVTYDGLDAARQQFVDISMMAITGALLLVLVTAMSCCFIDMLKRSPIVDFFDDEDNVQLRNAHNRLQQLEVRNYIEGQYHVIEIGPGHVYVQKREKSPKRPVIHGTDRETDDSTRCCVICTVNEKQCTVVPCGHVIYCIACANKRQETKCPMCRKSMKQVVRIFV